MSGRNIAVFGVYPTPEHADAAVDALRAKGFRRADISVLSPQNIRAQESGHDQGTKRAEGAGAIGGTTGTLIGLGIPEYQARRYEGRMRPGGVLLSVHADDHEWVIKGKQILLQTGAEEISAIAETSSGATGVPGQPGLVTSAPSGDRHGTGGGQCCIKGAR